MFLSGDCFRMSLVRGRAVVHSVRARTPGRLVDDDDGAAGGTVVRDATPIGVAVGRSGMGRAVERGVVAHPSSPPPTMRPPTAVRRMPPITSRRSGSFGNSVRSSGVGVMSSSRSPIGRRVVAPHGTRCPRPKRARCSSKVGPSSRTAPAAIPMLLAALEASAEPTRRLQYRTPSSGACPMSRSSGELRGCRPPHNRNPATRRRESSADRTDRLLARSLLGE